MKLYGLTLMFMKKRQEVCVSTVPILQ